MGALERSFGRGGSRIEEPLTSGLRQVMKDQVLAMTYQGVSSEKYHIPPTQFYMDLLIQGAYAHGLSMMWISYLQSFGIQEGRKPRPAGDK